MQLLVVFSVVRLFALQLLGCSCVFRVRAVQLLGVQWLLGLLHCSLLGCCSAVCLGWFSVVRVVALPVVRGFSVLGCLQLQFV